MSRGQTTSKGRGEIPFRSHRYSPTEYFRLCSSYV